MDQNRERAAAQGIYTGDADLFCRVWERVGAQDRPDCPIETVRTQRNMPQQTMEEASHRTVQQTACQTAQETTHQMPPQERTVQETEMSGDDFPVAEDIPCLGRASALHGGQLQQYIREELEAWQLYRHLARRVGGPNARELAALATEKLHAAKRLAAVHFLIGGVRYWPMDGLTVPRLNSWLGVLREQFGVEQHRAYRYHAAACDTADPCLAELYRELAEESAGHAAVLRAVLETAL